MTKAKDQVDENQPKEEPVPEGLFEEPQEVDDVDLNFGFGEEDSDSDSEANDSDDDVSVRDGEEVTAEEDEPDGSSDDDAGEASDESAPEDEDDGEEAESTGDADGDTPEGDEGDDQDGEVASSEDKSKAANDKGKSNSKKTRTMVPKSRLDEVLAKNRELNAKLKAVEKSKPAAKDDAAPFDFDAKESEYMDAVLEGDKAGALAIRKEINEAQKNAWSTEVNTGNTVDRQRELFEEASAGWEARFEVLNPASDNFDKNLTTSIIAYTKGLQDQGESPIEALDTAAETLLRANGYITDDAPADTPKKAAPKSKPRGKTTGVKDKVDASKRQPRELSGGEGSAIRENDELDVSQLSDEEFEALPAATLARLRGDHG